MCQQVKSIIISEIEGRRRREAALEAAATTRNFLEGSRGRERM